MKKVLSVVLAVAVLVAFTTTVSLAVSRGEAVKAVTAPTIDGTIDDMWSAVPELESTIKLFGTGEPATGKTKVMWDESTLYFLTVVTDNEISHTSPTNWDKDCVEYFVDEDNSKGAEYDSVDDAHLRAGVDGDPASAEGCAFPEQVAQGFAKTETGYVVEYSYKAMNPLKEGQVIGFDFMVSDDQGDGKRDTAMCWNEDATGDNWRDASVFGEIELKGAADTKGTAETKDAAEDTVADTGADVSAIYAVGTILVAAGAALQLRRK